MKCRINPRRSRAAVSPMIYGSFIEHHHRQVYGGIYDPKSKFADEDGFRGDVIEAVKQLKTPVIRWPGGCFVDDYHWKNGVGPDRLPSFDKNWKVEELNTFGTDEFMKFCRKTGAEPYLCTNATASPEEASDWVEYCNLESDGRYAKARIANGYEKPWGVKYWSIGNENYFPYQVGGSDLDTWLRYSLQTAKVMKRVDPDIELSAAMTMDNLEWCVRTLEQIGFALSWVSLHGYWDFVYKGDLAFGTVPGPKVIPNAKNADYEECMRNVEKIRSPIARMRALLTAAGFDSSIKIAFDEWNLRGWYHPYILEGHPNRKEDYLPERSRNDDNSLYTMADAVFSACFLNECLRNADIVGMANFSPLVNTRGAIFTHENGIVKRSTYHVLDLYMNHFGNERVDIWSGNPETYETGGTECEVLDVAAAERTADGVYTVAVANKDAENSRSAAFDFDAGFAPKSFSIYTVNGEDKASYNDVGRDEICIVKTADKQKFAAGSDIRFEPHSVNIIEFEA